MARYKCVVCEYIYDEEKSGTMWEDLPEGWVCPVCESPKKLYAREPDAQAVSESASVASDAESAQIMQEPDKGSEITIDLQKTMADAEPYFADIKEIAETGQMVSEPMRTKIAVISWDDILIKGAQLAKMPLDHEDPVNVKTVIGRRAKKPMELATPVYISHMSFGALSREAKIALAQGSAAVQTAICSGEGGILPDEMSAACKYVFEYVPRLYSVTEENLKKADAIEIKVGQSAKPGMGGHLPGRKVTSEIAAVRGVKAGEDIVSPSHFKDIRTREDLKKRVDWLRETSGGKPVGIKLAAGNIEADLEVAVFAGPDFITLDGRAGATGSAPKFVKNSTSVPTLFALYRARKYLDEKGTPDISLMITGGLRVSSDFAKALALGADAVAISTSALIAIGCQQYRVCNTGKCPMGIATQDSELRRRLKGNVAAERLANFLRVSTADLEDFARLTGNDDVHKLSLVDLCTANSEISNYTGIEHV